MTDANTFNYKFALEKTDGAEVKPGFIKGIATTPKLDTYDDIIAVGAFEASIKDRGVSGPRAVKMLAQHDTRNVIGNWLMLKYEGEKLMCEGQIDVENTKGAEYYSHVKKDQIGSLSVGFTTQTRQYDEETNVRTIIKGDLREISLVTFPANEDAVITQVKSAGVKKLSEIEKLVVAECGLSRRQSQKLIQVVRSSGLLASAADDPAPSAVTIPKIETRAEATSALNQFMEEMKREKALREIRALTASLRA
jgi:HK97 family phage prohead protease